MNSVIFLCIYVNLKNIVHQGVTSKNELFSALLFPKQFYHPLVCNFCQITLGQPHRVLNGQQSYLLRFRRKSYLVAH